MRLKTLYEANLDDENNIFLKFKEIINKECSEICSIYREADYNVLWRGSSKSPYKEDLLNRIKPRLDRKPKDTNPRIHKKMDDLFYKIFGWKARSQGIFTTPGWNRARVFGHYIYAIFPANGFKYVWNPLVQDIYSSLPSGMALYEKHIKESPHSAQYAFNRILQYFSNNDPKPYKYSEIKELDPIDINDRSKIAEIYEFSIDKQLEKVVASYKDNNLSDLLVTVSDNEVSIKCDYYYAIETDMINGLISPEQTRFYKNKLTLQELIG